MLVVVAGAASSRNDGGARAQGARSLGARRRGVSEGGSGLLGWAAALVVGLLVVSVAVVLGELALTLVGVPVSAAAPVTLFQSVGPLGQLAGVACPSVANDAAYLTLSRAVTQLRRSEIVTPGVGLTVCVVCGVSNEKVGFGRAFSLQSQSECITHTLE